MNFMGVDVGGSTRNGIAIVTDKDLLVHSENIAFNKKEGIGAHGRKVAARVRELVEQHNVEAIVIERVKMHRGANLSKLASIISLAKITARIIDRVYDICKVFDIETVSWKAEVLGNRSATKDDAVWYIKQYYKKEVPHDEADAICEAIFLARNYFRNDSRFKELTDK